MVAMNVERIDETRPQSHYVRGVTRQRHRRVAYD